MQPVIPDTGMSIAKVRHMENRQGASDRQPARPEPKFAGFLLWLLLGGIALLIAGVVFFLSR